MIYLVIYCETYIGYFPDENIRYFNRKEDAVNYCQKLNLELADANNCKVENLGDYYEIVEIERG